MTWQRIRTLLLGQRHCDGRCAGCRYRYQMYSRFATVHFFLLGLFAVLLETTIIGVFLPPDENRDITIDLEAVLVALNVFGILLAWREVRKYRPLDDWPE